MIISDATIRPGKWSHIAGVFTSTETRLYLNGTLVGTGPGSTDGETHFVIGNVGEDNLLDYFRGVIRAARITDGQRYEQDFEPPEVFDDDADTLLIITPEQIEGDMVMDTTGQVIGRVERVGEGRP